MHRTCLLAGLAFAFALESSGVLPGDEVVAVTTSRRVHPVLIRNDTGSVLQIIIDVKRGDNVRLKALHFTLAGSDDVDDIDSLRLFATGNKNDFATTAPVGKPIRPNKKFVAPADTPIRPGKNVFWLSCRLKPTADLSHKIRAVCTSVETTAGTYTAKDLSPGVRQRIGMALRKHKDDGVHTYRIPALTTTPKGTLLCVYDMRRRMARDLQEDIDIGLSRSTDGGKSWETPRVIMDMGQFGGLPEEQNGCSDPGIIVDPTTGEIFCFAVWMNGNPGKHQWRGDGSAPGYEIGKAAQILMVRSRDDGLTWSKPQNLTRTLKPAPWWLFAPSPQQGIALPDGTLVMPVQGRDAKGIEFSTIMSSRDHGKSWKVGAPAYSGGSECQAVQLGDGSIMLNMRNEHERFRAVFVTKDLGKSWQPHATNRKTLIEPNCNGSLLRVDYTENGNKKHVLLFANPHAQKGRTHQSIQVSFDDGLTWPKSHRLLLDEGRGAGYPSLARIDERHIGIVYEGSQAHLVFEKLRLADLLKPAAPSAPAAGSSSPQEAQDRLPAAGGLLSLPADPKVGLRAGVAKIDITNKQVKPFSDPLYVKALVLKTADTTAVLITLDAVAVGEIGPIPKDYLGKVRARLAKDLAIPANCVVVTASHCHGIVCADVDDKTVEAVKAAAANLVPVKTGVGVGSENRISENRRLKLKSGKEADVRHAYALPPDDEVAEVGPIDPHIGVLRLDKLDGQTLAVVYNFACHPIMGMPNGGNTADVIGFASRVIEDNLSPGTVALFVQGCGGDINPIRYKDIHQPRSAETLGNMLGLSALQTIRKIRCEAGATFTIRNQKLELPRADHSTRIDKLSVEKARLVKSLQGTSLNLRSFLELAGKYNLSREFPSYYAHLYLTEKAQGRDDLRNLDAANRRNLQAYMENVVTMERITRLQTNIALLQKHELTNRAAGRKPLEVELVGLRIGEFVLVTFPGELTVEIGLNVKKTSPHKTTFVAGYTNGYIYYTPTAKQIRNFGEAQEDCDCLVAPEWEALFYSRVAELLKKL